ncbi:MAG: acetyl-CoA hydrolase/transferase family protein [Porticoccaceae bacterium]
MTYHASSLSDIGQFVAAGESLYLSGCAAEIPGFEQLDIFKARANPLTISGIFLPGINRHDYTSLGDNIACQTFFMTPQLSAARGRVEYCPWRYRDVLSFYQRQPVDIAVVMLSEPDANGVCSYGVCADYAPVVMPQARVKIGVINKHMPYTAGCAGINIADLDVVVTIDQPLIDVPSQTADETSAAMAKTVAGYIGDGATLQLGLGKVPSSVVTQLADRRNLRVISGLLDESMMALETSGAMAADQPAIVGVGLGTANFYRALDRNERFQFQPVSVTHDLQALSQTPNLVTVNGALEVDLFGQVNSSVTSRGHLSGPGGLPEFVSSALSSKGGRSIIVLPATAGRDAVSKIVPSLTGSMPSVSAIDADTVVTEYGAAELRGKSLTQRIRAMIAIAAPEHRERLEEQSRKLV